MVPVNARAERQGTPEPRERGEDSQGRQDMQSPFDRCNHPEARLQDIGPARAYTAPVALAPYTEENPAAHGNIRQLVECTACGGRRHENRNQHHREVSPWWDEAGEQAREQRAAQREREEHARHISVIRKAYGSRGDICVDQGRTAYLRFGPTEIVIGSNLEDAARRAQTDDRLAVREVMHSHGIAEA